MASLIRRNRSRFSVFLMVLALAFPMWPLTSTPLAAAGDGGQARAFVQGLADKAVAALTEPGVPDAQREARIRQLLDDYFAVDTIGQWVLGRYWRGADPEQRRQYLQLFRDMIVVTYMDRFKRYSGQTLTVSNVVGEADSQDAIVQTQITQPGAPNPVNVGWRVRSGESGMKIVDVIVEGVSMSQTQRSEFGSVISRGGGDVSVLLEQMRRVVGREP